MVQAKRIVALMCASGLVAGALSRSGVPLQAADLGTSPQHELAGILVQDSGISGGLIVHLGCGDGRLTAALGQSGPFLVHGLDTDASRVARARASTESLDLYGKVSVDRFDGLRLPYVDNLVNLLVSDEPLGVPIDEVLRVLVPGGVAQVRQGDRWTKTIKPWPKEIDQWTHFLHDASNNAVSQDSVVGPPGQLQWVGSPTWARSHDHLASISALVSAGGRVFYIVDEGPTAAVVLSPRWLLVARDAFNGEVLWKRPIPHWQWHLRGFRSGPSDLSRRLVAIGDRVYVTLGIDAPVSVLDAETGQTVETYPETAGARELVWHNGMLLVVVADRAVQQAAAQAKRRGARPAVAVVRSQRPAYPEPPPWKRLLAVDTARRRVLWAKADDETNEIMPTTLATNGQHVFFQNPDVLLCLDSQSGNEVCGADRPVSRSRPTWSAPTLVVYGDVVLSADRAVAGRKTLGVDDRHEVQWMVSSAGGQAPEGQLIAFSAATGERLWSCPCRECYNAPVDVLVADGLVWTGSLVRASDPGITEGRDPKTGQVKRTRPRDREFFQLGMGHQRCYRNKATCRYLVLGRSGVEFVDVATGKAIPNHWTRGTCQYGVMPCNGLLYSPSDSCACFITAKLNGFHCLAPRRDPITTPTPHSNRLERGPAYAKTSPTTTGTPPSPSTDWPTYRHDGARSGRTDATVPAALEPSWQVDLGGKLSSPVIAEGKLLVAQVDTHTVHAMDSKSGKRLWSYTAGGRVDSPPTVGQGHVLFGSADGWVYCLRASDGALAWRFRAAPEDRRLVAYGQIESLWPVPGSVLLRDGVVYCIAGRSSYLEGGIGLYRLDAKTGRKLSETVIDDRDPKTGHQRKGVVRGTNMPGALPDVLSCDGESVYLRHRRFDLDGQPQPPDVPHLFSSVGFLDDTWWHRTYWMMGATMSTNYGGWPAAGNRLPAGRMLTFDDRCVFGFGRNQYIHHGAHVGIDGATVFHYRPAQEANQRRTYYQAFAIQRQPQSDGPLKAAAKRRRGSGGPSKKYLWTTQLPMLARATVLTSDTLFFAGPPDIFASDDPEAAWQGKKGGLLLALSTTDGRQLARRQLDSPPVWDGMAAAGTCLYLATTDGKVISFGGR